MISESTSARTERAGLGIEVWAALYPESLPKYVERRTERVIYVHCIEVVNPTLWRDEVWSVCRSANTIKIVADRQLVPQDI